MLLVWGSNATGAFPPPSDTDSDTGTIPQPTELEGSEGVQVLWMGWGYSIGRRGDDLFGWGIELPPIRASTVRKILGTDDAEGYLDTEGYLHVFPPPELASSPLPGSSSSSSSSSGSLPTVPPLRIPPGTARSKDKWADMALTQDAVLALSPAGDLLLYPELDAVLGRDRTIDAEMDEATAALGPAPIPLPREPIRIALPPFPPPLAVPGMINAPALRLHTTEMRAFLHYAGGGMQMLFEVDVDAARGEGAGEEKGPGTGKGKGRDSGAASPAGSPALPAVLRQINVDALSFNVIPGSSNRLGVLTDTGEAYLLLAREEEPELVEVEVGPAGSASTSALDREGAIGGATRDNDGRGASIGAEARARAGAEARAGKGSGDVSERAAKSDDATGTGKREADGDAPVDVLNTDQASHGGDVSTQLEPGSGSESGSERLPPDVRLLGVGGDFMVVVRDDGVYLRGSNDMCQLGTTTTLNDKGEASPSEDFIRLLIDPERVRAVHCSQWTTLIELNDGE